MGGEMSFLFMQTVPHVLVFCWWSSSKRAGEMQQCPLHTSFSSLSKPPCGNPLEHQGISPAGGPGPMGFSNTSAMICAAFGTAPTIALQTVSFAHASAMGSVAQCRSGWTGRSGSKRIVHLWPAGRVVAVQVDDLS